MTNANAIQTAQAQVSRQKHLPSSAIFATRKDDEATTPSPYGTDEAPPPEPVVEVYDRYQHALVRLPGVTGVRADGAGLCIETRAKRDSRFLDALLENEIGGVPVRFEETEPPAPPKPRRPARPGQARPGGEGHAKKPRAALSPAERVLRRYGKALSAMPHVTGVAVKPEGGRNPDEASAVAVKVDQADAVGYMQDLVEDSVLGVLVSFETA